MPHKPHNFCICQKKHKQVVLILVSLFLFFFFFFRFTELFFNFKKDRYNLLKINQLLSIFFYLHEVAVIKVNLQNYTNKKTIKQMVLLG